MQGNTGADTRKIRGTEASFTFFSRHSHTLYAVWLAIGVVSMRKVRRERRKKKEEERSLKSMSSPYYFRCVQLSAAGDSCHTARFLVEPKVGVRTPSGGLSP